ncbi:MAG: dephospho-CoA kinase [Myxococcales bacterium]|nr:dephospho-CoA kinase [Myxococcales bacterium]
MSIVIGLTGGIASGKSSVARIFEELGATVLDADAIVRELQSPGSPVLEEIAAAFGRELIRDDGSLDREALGAIAFGDEGARRRLNAIVHPRVAAEITQRVAAARAQGAAVIVIDIPLLFETRDSADSGVEPTQFDATVAVHVPQSLQIERQMLRDGCSRAQAEQRLRAQMPLDHKRSLADFTIDNAGTPEETERQVRRILRTLSEAPP